MNVAYAVHKLDGIITPANAAYSALELQYQLKDAGAKALFTCLPLLETALEAAKGAGIPKEKVYILEMPAALTGGKKVPFKTVDDFVEDGKTLPALEPLKWKKGQGGTQTAFLCYSSGTSGLPVSLGIMLVW
jgi:acyl-CoA synthetase (AMP-forming)/AMP-acid ligase II